MNPTKAINYGLTGLLILFGLTAIFAILTPGVPAGGAGVMFALVLGVILVVEKVTGVA